MSDFEIKPYKGINPTRPTNRDGIVIIPRKDIVDILTCEACGIEIIQGDKFSGGCPNWVFEFSWRDLSTMPKYDPNTEDWEKIPMEFSEKGWRPDIYKLYISYVG